MSRIELTNVTKRWGQFYAVDNLSMVIEDNAFATLRVNDTDELSVQLGLTDGDDTRGYPNGRFAPIHDESVQERFLKLAWQRSFDAESELSVKYSHQGHETNGQWNARVAGNPLVYIDFDTTRDALETPVF